MANDEQNDNRKVLNPRSKFRNTFLMLGASFNQLKERRTLYRANVLIVRALKRIREAKLKVNF